MKPLIYSANRTSGFETSKYVVKYGEDETDPMTGDWCGVVYQKRTNGLVKEVFRATNTVLLEYACGDSPDAMLIATLALFLSK